MSAQVQVLVVKKRGRLKKVQEIFIVQEEPHPAPVQLRGKKRATSSAPAIAATTTTTTRKKRGDQVKEPVRGKAVDVKVTKTQGESATSEIIIVRDIRADFDVQADTKVSTRDAVEELQAPAAVVNPPTIIPIIPASVLAPELSAAGAAQQNTAIIPDNDSALVIDRENTATAEVVETTVQQLVQAGESEGAPQLLEAGAGAGAAGGESLAAKPAEEIDLSCLAEGSARVAIEREDSAERLGQELVQGSNSEEASDLRSVSKSDSLPAEPVESITSFSLPESSNPTSTVEGESIEGVVETPVQEIVQGSKSEETSDLRSLSKSDSLPAKPIESIASTSLPVENTNTLPQQEKCPTNTTISAQADEPVEGTKPSSSPETLFAARATSLQTSPRIVLLSSFASSTTSKMSSHPLKTTTSKSPKVPPPSAAQRASPPTLPSLSRKVPHPPPPPPPPTATPAPPRPTQLPYHVLQKDPQFKALSRKYTNLIIALPVALVTSYVLYDRYNSQIARRETSDGAGAGARASIARKPIQGGAGVEGGPRPQNMVEEQHVDHIPWVAPAAPTPAPPAPVSAAFATSTSTSTSPAPAGRRRRILDD